MARNLEKEKAAIKAWHAAHPEVGRESRRKYREANKAKIAATNKAWYEATKDQRLAYGKAWKDANKERRAATNKAWEQANRGKANAKASHRRAMQLSATPPWQSREELDEIWIGCPEGHHVDHIHPLKGKLSCGLNVPWNLNYLPAEENMSKGNRMPPPGYLDWFGHDKELSEWPHP